MKQIRTLTNSFLLQETDPNGKVISELGFKKGGVSYLIKNNNVKFYLYEDYFYKNVIWSADVPLVVDDISYDINALPTALKKIFVTEKGSGSTEVDQELDSGSTNAIANQAVTRAINTLEDEVGDRYTKEETNTLLESYLTKINANAMFANYSQVSGSTLILNAENIS